MIQRDDLTWDVQSDIRRRPEDKPWQGFRLLCVDDAGTPQGYASYTVDKKWDDMRPQYVVELSELVAATPDAEIRLWRFLAELDLVAAVRAGDRPTDELLPWLIDNGRLAKQVAQLRLRVGASARRAATADVADRTTRPAGSWSRSSTTRAWPAGGSRSTPRRTGRRASRRPRRPS